MRSITLDLCKFLNIYLLGIDIIIDSENQHYHVVDINYLPDLHITLYFGLYFLSSSYKLLELELELELFWSLFFTLSIYFYHHFVVDL
eukprot:Pgem_evm1s2416